MSVTAAGRLRGCKNTYSGSSCKRTPSGRKKGVRNWSWPLTGNVKIHTVDALVSGNPRDAKKVSVTGAGRLGGCKNTYSGSSCKRTPSGRKKGVRNWSWPLTGNVKIHTVDALVSGNPRDAKKVSVTGAGRLGGCKNTYSGSSCKRTPSGREKGVRYWSWPLTRMTVRKASTVRQNELLQKYYTPYCNIRSEFE